MDYQQLIGDAVGDAGTAFRAALEADDPVAVAVVSIVAPSTESSTAVDRFDTFVAHYGATLTTTELVAGILERAADLKPELAAAAEKVAARRDQPLPLEEKHTKRIEALVRDLALPDTRRRSLLIWLYRADRPAARQIADALLSNPDEPYENTLRFAISILGSYGDSNARASLAAFANRHLEGVTAQAGEPVVDPRAGLSVINALWKPTDDDLELIGRVLADAARQNLAISGQLDGLLARLGMGQVASLVAHVEEAGYVGWLAQQFLPALIAARPRDAASTADSEWWPEECLTVFAQTGWEEHDDRLYPVVLERLHRTGDEAACASIRQRVAQRCQSTSSNAPSEMPRIGARALLKLALAGSIDIGDPSLLAALRAIDVDSLADEITNANWRRPERAHRVGHIVAGVNAAVFPAVVSHAVRQGSASAAAVIAAGTPEALDENLDDLLAEVLDDEAALAALCEKSPTAAQLTLKSWQEEPDLIAFRALASTPHAEDRLATIPDAVRSYGGISTEERAELLEAYHPRDDCPEVLCGILEDRHNQGSNRPTAEDLIHALQLLGDHLGAGLAPNLVIGHIGMVCTEAPQRVVREAGYAALGDAQPTSDLLDLLLNRRSHEAPPVRPAVAAALSRIGDKLDEVAADAAGSERGDAVGQLARIDPNRAVVHARELLKAEHAAVRGSAVSIIGTHGCPADADDLEAILIDEPSPEVQSQLRRAIRRLRVGDSAAAHERIGELADLEDLEAWLALEPAKVYGRWVEPLVEGLGRIAEAESKHEFGTAIDQLSEIAQALLFRAIEVAGEQIGFSKADRAKAATNDLDYGSVLSRQQLNQNWPWVPYFASLHGLRTEHIASRRTMDVPPQRTADHLKTAYIFFGLGARPCCELLMKMVAGSDAGSKKAQ